ncbi:MAG: glycine cleavage system protein T [Isosphaeraceae bacterium]|nr:MAG: glycine cleavage system protein T [Isosphaeraceae bacterium]
MNGWIDRSDRARLLVRGTDRIRLLHNLTTQDVKRMEVGRGAEAFVTSPQGRTLGYVTLHLLDDAVLVRADAGGLVEALPHLRKYAVFDDVEWEPVEDRTFEWHLIGDEVSERLRSAGLATPADEDRREELAGWERGAIGVIRESPTGQPGWTLIGPRIAAADVADRLLAGLRALTAEEFELGRIRAGTPVWGREVTPARLPQELDRDSRAISFTKGCYLGQETVARLDALGHVNQILRGLVFERPEAPIAGMTLYDEEGKPAGSVTSAAAGGTQSTAIGLGLIRTRCAQPGTPLRLEDGQGARVSRLPIER